MKTVILWEYKVGINAIIANFVCIWKSRLGYTVPSNKVGIVTCLSTIKLPINGSNNKNAFQ